MVNVHVGVFAFGESVRVIASTSGHFMNADDLTRLRVDDRNDGKRVSPEVGFTILAVSSIDECLHMSTVGVISFIKTTIGPWLNNNVESLRKVELGNSLLEECRVSADVADIIKLLTVGVC